MVVQVPIEVVNSFTMKFFLNTAFNRRVEVGNIRFDHSYMGTVYLRKLDEQSTEITFSNAFQPEVVDVIRARAGQGAPGREEWARIVPESAEHALTYEAYLEWLAERQVLIEEYTRELRLEEERVRGLAQEQARAGQPAVGLSGSLTAKLLERPPAARRSAAPLSADEQLCLAWVNRPAFPYQNMEEFLYEMGDRVSKAQFKRMLREYGKKGLLVKQGSRWKPAP